METIQKNKIIIFSEFSEFCKILKRELYERNPAMVIGETTTKMKEKELMRFKTDPSCHILISSSAGAFGLNLTEANYIIHADQPWSISKLLQREGRSHRIGQKNKVQIINLLAKGTVDYYVKKILHGKAELSSQLLGDTPISMSDIKDILNYEA